MINILHGVKQARPQGSKKPATDRRSEEEKINGEAFLFPPHNTSSETAIQKPQRRRKIQVTAPLLVHSAVGGALISPVSGSGVFFFFLTRRGGVSEELVHVNSRRPRSQNSVRAKQQNRKQTHLVHEKTKDDRERRLGFSISEADGQTPHIVLMMLFMFCKKAQPVTFVLQSLQM